MYSVSLLSHMFLSLFSISYISSLSLSLFSLSLSLSCLCHSLSVYFFVFIRLSASFFFCFSPFLISVLLFIFTYILRTSWVADSKCEVASNDFETKILLSLPSSVHSIISLTATNFSSILPNSFNAGSSSAAAPTAAAPTAAAAIAAAAAEMLIRKRTEANHPIEEAPS